MNSIKDYQHNKQYNSAYECIIDPSYFDDGFSENYQKSLDDLKKLPQDENTFLLASKLIAEAAGKAITYFLHEVENGADLGLQIKADNEKIGVVLSPVTIADARANDIICKSIRYLFPTHAINSEEERIDPQEPKRDYTWVIDPLDGTREFKKAAQGNKGITHYGVHVGVIDKLGRSILGTTHLPALRTSVWAAKGKGTYRQVNGNLPEKVEISPSDNDSRVHLIVSRSIGVKPREQNRYAQLLGLDPNSTPEDRANFEKLYHEVVNDEGQEETYSLGQNRFSRIGGAGVKACSLIFNDHPGNLYVGYGPHEWDVASWAIAVEEAGGVVTDLEGNPLEFTNTEKSMPRGYLVARTKALHARALEIIRNTDGLER